MTDSVNRYILEYYIQSLTLVIALPNVVYVREQQGQAALQGKRRQEQQGWQGSDPTNKGHRPTLSIQEEVLVAAISQHPCDSQP